MYRMAVAPPFKLEWDVGESKMLVISAGTGSIPRLGSDAQHPSRSVFEVALGIAGELMNGMAYDQDINCRTIGRCVFGAPPELTRDGLDDLALTRIDPARVATLDSIDAIDDLLHIGRSYAQKHLKIETHIGSFLPRGK
jgi:uncharacterized protein